MTLLYVIRWSVVLICEISISSWAWGAAGQWKEHWHWAGQVCNWLVLGTLPSKPIRCTIHYTHLEGSYHKSQKLNLFPSQRMRNIYIIFVNIGDIPYGKATGHPAICEPVTSDYCKSKNSWIPSCEVSEATTLTPISERAPTSTTTTTSTHSFKTQPTKATTTGIIYSHL